MGDAIQRSLPRSRREFLMDYKDVFIHSTMKVEVWQDAERALWIA